MKPRITLALSGGGFRASIFHLGLLRRLAELGWLPDVDVISTVSGGSIVGAFAVLRWEAFLQAGGDAEAFESIIAAPFLALHRDKRKIPPYIESQGKPQRVFRNVERQQCGLSHLSSGGNTPSNGAGTAAPAADRLDQNSL